MIHLVPRTIIKDSNYANLRLSNFYPTCSDDIPGGKIATVMSRTQVTLKDAVMIPTISPI